MDTERVDLSIAPKAPLVMNQAARDRIRQVRLTGDELVHMFDTVLQHAQDMESEAEESGAALYYKTDGTAKVGEVVPFIQLMFIRVTEENIDKVNQLSGGGS